MKSFMPGTQPRGTHAFNPFSESDTRSLDAVNAEEDGEEDQICPLDSPMAKPAAHAASSESPLINPDLQVQVGASSSSGGTSSIVLGSAAASASLSSGGTRPLPSSSLPPSVHLQATRKSDTSMGSIHSITTGSVSDTASGQKRKRDARSMSGMQPPTSKRDARSMSGKQPSRRSLSKNDDLNPVIISSALNSTLNRMADVMERSLDVTSTIAHAAQQAQQAQPPLGPPLATAPTTIPSVAQVSESPSIITSPSSSSASPTEIIDQVIRIISANDGFLSDDELLAASLFFTSASEEAVRAARTFISLGSNHTVQHRFLCQQLESAALLSGKGKGKARAVDLEEGDHSMVY